MAENENVLEPNPAPEKAKPAKGKNFKANLKEWFRKKAVGLKRAPQNIPLAVIAITTVYFMLALYMVSQAVDKSYGEPTTPATGICVFITTLLSLLVLVSFLNAFPKRKKPNIFFIVLVFVMLGAMIACDLVYYFEMIDCLNGTANPETSEIFKIVSMAQPYMLVHVVLVGISALVFALLPVYKKFIMKINTKVELESATESMQENIDIQED